jgi:hypothetical protein
VTNRPQLRDILTQEQIDALVTKGIEKVDAGESLMLKFMLEQIFGKAPMETACGKCLREPRTIIFTPAFDFGVFGDQFAAPHKRSFTAFRWASKPNPDLPWRWVLTR